LVSGGGLAGLTTAAVFGAAGFDVICVDPVPPHQDNADRIADLRTTAILQPGRNLLEQAGVWHRFEAHAQPLQVMQIVDVGGPDPTPRVVRRFDAQDISGLPFGWNLPNRLLHRVLAAHLDGLDNVTVQPGIGVAALLARTGMARVRLTDGGRITCRMVIAADGRHSVTRMAAGIGVTTTRYGQKALAFAVTHPIPHENMSTEIHRSGGPFTLVPLPDRDGMPCSAVVWMQDGPTALQLSRIGIPAFESAMTERSCSLFGPLTLVSRRSLWPVISQIAQRLDGRRVALVAEAAHVVPPIGAQGLNTSLADVQTLRDLAVQSPQDLGSSDMLKAYHKLRYADIRMRVIGVDLLNRASQAAAQPLRDARAAGLRALYAAKPLRKTLMQMGLGLR